MPFSRAAFLPVVLAVLALAHPSADDATRLTLNGAGYLSARGLDVLVFQNRYSGEFDDSKLSGVEIVQHGVRVATNGDVRLSNAPEQWDPLPAFGRTEVDAASNRIAAHLSYPKYQFEYAVSAEPSGAGVLIRVTLPRAVPAALEGHAGFNLEFLPSAYFGKGFVAGATTGILPRYATGPTGVSAFDGKLEPRPLATAGTLVLAPEDPERRVTIDGRGTALSLYDGRARAQNGWFVVRGLLPAGRTGTVLEWLVTPHRIDGWTRPPVIAHSQLGYHPAQEKVAVVELDPAFAGPRTIVLSSIAPDGGRVERLRGTLQPWGRYLRYDYGRFDFSTVREPGLYVLTFGNVTTAPFRIDPDVFRRDAWQQTLDTYFPVAMDHMLVNDRYRVWHGASHMDDALQAAPDQPHFDLYGMGPADSPYAPGEHVPGLAAGGWYDAGDFDIRTQTTYAVVQTLAQAYETFHIDRDQTLVSQKDHFVDIGRPDGVPDLLQQIEHGTLSLLGQYRAFGHAIPGIIEPTLDQYTHLGDAVTKTDGRVYDPALQGKAPADGRSGVKDDRLAFTTHTTALNYGAAAALAAASRVLAGIDATLATECRDTAIKAWEYEQGHPPATFRVGNTTGGRIEDEELNATVELLVLTKGERRFADRLNALWPYVEKTFAFSAPRAVRALPYMDEAWRTKVAAGVAALEPTLRAQLAKNPFGVPIATGGWGGSGGVLGFAMSAYVLHQAFPDVIGPEYTLRGLNYVLGAHPASDVSMVSGVGAHSKTVAYGNNRADFAAIPGGVVPGIVIVKPDLPELQEDWPFLWFENEYVINVGALYLYVVHAADDLVNGGSKTASTAGTSR